MRAGILGLLATFAACGVTPDAGRSGDGPPPAVPVRRALPPGTVVAIADSEFTVAGRGPRADVVDGLLREALRQSPRLDFGGGREAPGAAAHVLRPRIDPVAGTLALELESDAAPRVPLALESFGPSRPLGAAIDRAAWAARLALGEDLPQAPPRTEVIYSAIADCVAATERGLADEARGLAGVVAERVAEAIAADPACTITATLAATAALASGATADAERIASRGLSAYRHRLSPTTQHRLARVLLLARAAAELPGSARRHDADLLALADEFLAERPHDPHGHLSRGLAAAHLGDFDRAVATLTPLARRWPEVPQVGYYLACSMLALGRPLDALTELDRIERRLPRTAALWPRALALLAAGHHEDLDALLDRALQSEPAVSPLRHEILRMRAAHALLRGNRDRAAAELLADLEWIRARPSQADRFAADLAELGESLVEIGYAPALELRLAAFAPEIGTGSEFRAALGFLTGLAAARRDVDAPEVAVALQRLTQGDHTAYAARLRAEVHRRRGELDREAAELATTIRIAAAPLWRAAFIRALRQLGDRALLEPMIADTRAELSGFDLRRPGSQPLAGPGRALAWLACSRDE